MLELTRPLTATEHQVALLVKGGLTNPEVARFLGCTEKTVKNHLNAIYKKGVANRNELRYTAWGYVGHPDPTRPPT